MGLRAKQGYTRKKRDTNTRQRKSIFVIATEGKNKTEKLYFKQFNSDRMQLRFAKGNATDPIKLISELKDECKEIDFSKDLGDKAYCVIDSDFSKSKDKQIFEADNVASKNNIEVIVSSPCFEIWYLCHFVFSAKQYSSYEELLKELKKYIPDYTKSKDGIYQQLKLQQEQAIENAKKLEKANLQNGKKRHTVEFMPSTEVYKIVEAVKCCEKNCNDKTSG